MRAGVPPADGQFGGSFSASDGAPGSDSQAEDESASGPSGLDLLDAAEEATVRVDPVAMAQHLRMHQRRRPVSFEFTDPEIKEAFDQLDFNKQGFLTAAELTLFLDVLKVPSTEAEVCEMVRMADTQGLNKVFFHDFQQLLQGELVRTLAIPLPDTLALLDNINLATELDPQKKRELAATARSRLDFVPPSRPQAEPGQARRSEKSKMLSPAQRRAVLEDFFQFVAFDFQKVFPRLQKENLRLLHINDFSRLFPTEDKTRIVDFYESLGTAGCVTLNLAELLTNWIALQAWTENNRAYLAFMVQDLGGAGHLSFGEVAEIFAWLNLSSDCEPHAQALRRIFGKLELKAEEPIDLKNYEKIIHNFAHLLIKDVKPQQTE